MTKHLLHLAIFFASLGSFPAFVQADSTLPEYITAPRSCGILVAGNGASFAVPQVEKMWQAVNQNASAKIYDELKIRGYRVFELLIDITDKKSALRLVSRELAAKKCNRFITVYNDADEDQGGQFFQFTVSVFHIALTAPEIEGQRPRMVTALDFEKKYRYARTPSEIDIFLASDFGNLTVNDMEAGTALQAIKDPDFKSNNEKPNIQYGKAHYETLRTAE